MPESSESGRLLQHMQRDKDGTFLHFDFNALYKKQCFNALSLLACNLLPPPFWNDGNAETKNLEEEFVVLLGRIMVVMLVGMTERNNVTTKKCTIVYTFCQF